MVQLLGDFRGLRTLEIVILNLRYFLGEALLKQSWKYYFENDTIENILTRCKKIFMFLLMLQEHREIILSIF